MNRSSMPSGSAFEYARRLLRFLTKNKKNLSPLMIMTHDFPDPDGLGSGYALAYLCNQSFRIPPQIGGTYVFSQNFHIKI